MRLTQLKRIFLFRYILNKQFDHYTEVDTNVLMGIFVMEEKCERCSCNTLFKYLSNVHRTPYRKNLLLTIRKFKQDGVIRILGKGAGTRIYLTMDGRLYLYALEQNLNRIRF